MVGTFEGNIEERAVKPGWNWGEEDSLELAAMDVDGKGIGRFVEKAMN